ncbi:MAG: S-adenosyl-l-methionine hydroxide adenosyltransferase family protein [Rhodothermales bacterium]
MSLLTLTTDFGTRDAYVPAMKGTILAINPTARLIDITHDITPHDVMEAAFVLRQAVPYYPPGTVHLVVVDPGVGTERHPVALCHKGHIFVGPDNGLFSLLLGKTTPEALVVLDRPAFWRVAAPSDTFHGRDIFAPVAAHLAGNHALHEVGSPLESLKPLHWALPIDDSQGIRGWIVHIDHFGNCVTNIPRAVFERQRSGRPLKCYVGNAILEDVHPTYGAAADGEPLLLFGSSDFLEIAVNAGNASNLLDIRKGTPVNVVFLDEK